MEELKNMNHLLNYELFWNWLCNSRDYVFIGGKKPINNFPDFFHLYVYKNAPYVNNPDCIIEKNPEKRYFSTLSLSAPYVNIHDSKIEKHPETTYSFSLGFFILKCFWKDFLYETISHFHQELNVSYFARDSDNLQVLGDTACYEITLHMDNHIGKASFIMPKIEKQYDDTIVRTRVFLPKLNLTFNGRENVKIVYTQNKEGIGCENQIQDDSIMKNERKQEEPTKDSKLDLSNENPECFYFNKPFYIHILVDNQSLLTLHVAQTIQIR